jgi:hypothetical protein
MNAPKRGADRSRVAGQDEESRLECVLGVVLAMQLAAADAPHQRSVPPHQHGKSVHVASSDEALQ